MKKRGRGRPPSAIKTCQSLKLPYKKQCKFCRNRKPSKFCTRRSNGLVPTKKTKVSPMKLRKRKPKVASSTEILARIFEEDFDSENPSTLIQFKRSWNRFTRKSRRLRQLPPKHTSAIRTKMKKKKKMNSTLPVHLTLPLNEIVVDPQTRVYTTPRCGWNAMVRRVIQYGFIRMGKPAERNEFGNNVWRGPTGVIAKLQKFAGTSGPRNKLLVKKIIRKTLELGKKYDAGERTLMKQPRKRKLNQDDVNLAGQMLRSGCGERWTTAHVNKERISREGNADAGVDIRTLDRTLKTKFNAIVHKRQKKGTGSKDKNSIWARARVSFCKQLLTQLGTLLCFIMFYFHFISQIHVCRFAHSSSGGYRTRTGTGIEFIQSNPIIIHARPHFDIAD